MALIEDDWKIDFSTKNITYNGASKSVTITEMYDYFQSILRQDEEYARKRVLREELIEKLKKL